MSYLPHVDLAPLGVFLRRAREAARLSIKEFAFALDYSPTHLCDVENGRRRVTRSMCDDVSATLGIDRAELYARAGHLTDAVLGYLCRRPKALGVLELLAELDAGDGLVEELCLEARRRDRIAKDSPLVRRHDLESVVTACEDYPLPEGIPGEPLDVAIGGATIRGCRDPGSVPVASGTLTERAAAEGYVLVHVEVLRTHDLVRRPNPASGPPDPLPVPGSVRGACVEPDEPEFAYDGCPAIGVGGRHSEA